MQDYKKLEVWMLAHEICIETYKITVQFPSSEMYALTNQIRRCAVSIPSNIAEGAGKFSNAEFAHFLNIALGSINELEYQLFLSKEIQYLSNDTFESISLKINKLKAKMIVFINKVRTKI